MELWTIGHVTYAMDFIELCLDYFESLSYGLI